MKFFAAATAFLVGIAHAQLQGGKSVLLSFTNTHEHFVNRPVSAPNGGAAGWYPDSSTLFVGYQLPDGRIRVGGTDTWLSFNSEKGLGVYSGNPTNFGVTSNNTLSFQGKDTFNILNHSGNWVVYSEDATFGATAAIGPGVKLAVHYY